MKKILEPYLTENLTTNIKPLMENIVYNTLLI